MSPLRPDQVIPPFHIGSGLLFDVRPSLVREYFGTEPKKLLIFLGILLGVMVVVTVPYVLLVGFDKWSNDMGEAARMMWASYTPPPSGPPTGLPVAGSYTVLPAATPWTAAAGPGRQYVCPSCGTAHLPSWTPDGKPLCPLCRALMYAVPPGGREDLWGGAGPGRREDLLEPLWPREDVLRTPPGWGRGTPQAAPGFWPPQRPR